jgi:hypothetical protein
MLLDRDVSMHYFAFLGSGRFRLLFTLPSASLAERPGSDEAVRIPRPLRLLQRDRQGIREKLKVCSPTPETSVHPTAL